MAEIATSDLTQEIGTNFIEYAVAVNTDRAIPDSKSGLKPVAKRILYCAYDEGYTSNKVHVKCAAIVGDVMGQYHPHGDSSIYGALVRLAQPWVMRYPLIDFHGSYGNRDGDFITSIKDVDSIGVFVRKATDSVEIGRPEVLITLKLVMLIPDSNGKTTVSEQITARIHDRELDEVTKGSSYPSAKR